MSDLVQRWVDQAQYDFDTASAMMESKRYLYVLFCCQQSIEKMLKAIIVKKTSQFPPRLHDLLRLAEIGEIELDEERDLLFQELVTYYIQSRYPEEVQLLSTQATPQFTFDILKKTGETLQWLKSMIA